jgi:hypothetical protein
VISSLANYGFGISASIAALVATVDPLQVGNELGRMSSRSILGVISVTCVIAMVFIYRDRSRDLEKARKAHDAHTIRLYELIESNTRASEAHAEAARQAYVVLADLKEAVDGCHIITDSGRD